MTYNKLSEYRAVQAKQVAGFDKAIKGISQVIVNCVIGSPWEIQLTEMRNTLISNRGTVAADLAVSKYD